MQENNKTASYVLTVVVPVFNEEEGLENLFAALDKYLKEASVKTCVLFVNDHSQDRSLSLIQKACLEHEHFFFISLEERSGLTGALKAGFSACASLWCGYIDADLQTFPEDFNLLIPYMKTHDLICGIRAKRHDSLSKKLQSKIANFIRNSITHDGFTDTNCPLKIMKTELAQKFPPFSGMHRFMPALAQMLGYKVVGIPVRHTIRVFGKSKFGLLNRALPGLFDLFAFAWMRNRYLDPKFKLNNLFPTQEAQNPQEKAEESVDSTSINSDNQTSQQS